MVLAEPWRRLIVVTPPASCQYSVGMSWRMTSVMRTSAVIELVPSLIASAPACECSSMIPGITYLPEASITCAPAGTATSGPTAAIFPSRITIVPRGIVP
jgi:hypothetical protein